MKVTLEPTPEMWDGNINGVTVPFRIWAGQTEGGIKIEAYVFAITPNVGEDEERFRAELPNFMVPARDIADIGTDPKDYKE